MLFERLRHGAVSVVLLLLVACGSAPDRARPDALTGIKRIGVISLAAHEFYRQYIGYTVVGNESEKLDITAWKVDAEYELQMQSALAKLGRFEVVRVPYERKDFLGLYDRSESLDGGPVRRPKWGGVRENLQAIASSNSLDAIVVVVRRESEDFLTGTNQLFLGAGFYSRAITGSTRVSVLHLLGLVVLIEGRTGVPIASTFLARSPEGRTDTVARAAPMLIVPSDLSRARLAELGDARAADIRRWLIDLPRDAWEPTFRGLFADALH
ncbi:MAG: hypothetical protein ACXWCY_31480 [Burkholderiales bacterium]